MCITMCNCSYNRPFSNDYFSLDNVPAVTALLFRDGLTMGLGTSTGHVSSKTTHHFLLLYQAWTKLCLCFNFLFNFWLGSWRPSFYQKALPQSYPASFAAGDLKRVKQMFCLLSSHNQLLFWQVLLYDLRSTKPLLIKDHQYGLPINSIAFQDKLGVVLSADSKILKIWDRETVSIVSYQN